MEPDQVEPADLGQARAADESHTKKPTGWLDAQHGDAQPDPAEERFLELARSAWRSSNAETKRQMMKLIRELAGTKGHSGILEPSL